MLDMFDALFGVNLSDAISDHHIKCERKTPETGQPGASTTKESADSGGSTTSYWPEISADSSA